MKAIAVGITAIPLTGCALAVGVMFGCLLIAESYAPEYGSALFARAMVGFGLVETFALFVLGLVGLMLIF